MRIDDSLRVRPCIVSNAADATGFTGCMRIATTTGSVTHTIPAEMKGKWWRIMVTGANTRYGFVLNGTTAPTLVYATNAAFGTGAAAAGATLLNGVDYHVVCPPTAKEFVVISDGTAGFLEVHISGDK